MPDKKRKLPELLAPAGDMERLKMAVLYGADAVYLAGTDFGMRAFAGNFDPDELKAAVAYAHAHNVRVHCTINTMPRNDEAARLPEWLEYLDSLGVDAIILADVGTLALAAAHAPHVERHISTQASVVNYQSARAWHQLGAKRVILARELSLDEIREIRDNEIRQTIPSSALFLRQPSNIKDTIIYDPLTKRYVVASLIGGKYYYNRPFMETLQDLLKARSKMSLYEYNRRQI